MRFCTAWIATVILGALTVAVTCELMLRWLELEYGLARVFEGVGEALDGQLVEVGSQLAVSGGDGRATGGEPETSWR